MPTTNWEVAFGFQSNLFDFLAFYRGIKFGSRNVFKMYKVSCILMNMRCSFYGNHLATFFTWRFKTFSPLLALLWALINEALVSRVLHAAFRARSECRLSRAIFYCHRTNAPGSRSQSKRSGMGSNCKRSRIELAVLSTRQPPAQLSGTELLPAFRSFMIQISLS